MANSVYAAKDRGMSTSVYVSQNLGSGSSGVGYSGIGSHGVGSSFSASIDPGLVLVTGASGFVATHVVQLLMRNGYRVRGTVRDLTNKVKVRPILNLCPNPKYPLELIEADLYDPNSWDRAVQGCRYVIHMATLITSGSVDHNDTLVKAAVNGTLSVLRACHKHRVKRVVYTSSMTAIYGDFGVTDPPDLVYTEECWSRIEATHRPYHRAKTLAEMAAWDFLAQLPEHERFELAVVNPAGIFGPVLCGVPGSGSVLLKRLLSKEVPMVPKVSIAVVDVRDVALGHLRAMTVPQAAGRRIILFSGVNLWMEDVARLLYNEFQSQGYDIQTRVCPHILLRIMALFDKDSAVILPTEGRIQHIDNSAMRHILGITLIPADQTIIDMAYTMIERGFVKKARKFRRPPSGTCSSPTHS